MTKRLADLIPTAEALLQMEVEELAGYVLEAIIEDSTIVPSYFCAGLEKQYPVAGLSEIQFAVMEAWSWLEAESLVGQDPSQPIVRFVTRRGRKLKSHLDVEDLRKRAYLNKDLLHPIVLQNAFSLFMSGKYDSAVFQAFKDVEIAVRNASNIKGAIGVKLMREAFRPDPPGPLLLQEDLEEEPQALHTLFAGAIMACRNPVGHKNVGLNPKESAQLLIFASYLLSLVDDRLKA